MKKCYVGTAPWFSHSLVAGLIEFNDILQDIDHNAQLYYSDLARQANNKEDRLVNDMQTQHSPSLFVVVLSSACNTESYATIANSVAIEIEQEYRCGFSPYIYTRDRIEECQQRRNLQYFILNHIKNNGVHIAFTPLRASCLVW